MPWVGWSITKVGGGCLELPNLQVRLKRTSKHVTMSVHVKHQFGSVGGLLTTTTLHPSFEVIVHGVDPKSHKPEFCIWVYQKLQTTVCESPLAETLCVPFKTLKNFNWLVCGRLCGRSATSVSGGGGAPALAAALPPAPDGCAGWSATGCSVQS